MGRPLDQNLIHTTVNVLHVQPVCLITHLTQSHIQWLLEILKKRCSFNLDIIIRQTGTKSCNANHLGDTLTTVTKEQENIAGVGSRNDSAKPNSKFNQNNNNPMTEKIFLQEEGVSLVNKCFMCKTEEESIDHMLLQYVITGFLWQLVFSLFGLQWVIHSSIRLMLLS